MNHVVRRHRDSVLICLPLRLVNETNAREHWAARCGRAKTHRQIAGWTAKPCVLGMSPPYRVMITRIGPRRLDDDNLAASAKHVRDGIADALGIDDGDPRIAWMYDQRRCGPRDVTLEGYGVEVCITVVTAKTLSASRPSERSDA